MRQSRALVVAAVLSILLGAGVFYALSDPRPAEPADTTVEAPAPPEAERARATAPPPARNAAEEAAATLVNTVLASESAALEGGDARGHDLSALARV